MGENQRNMTGLKFKCQLAGWILFIVCALFFIASSIINQDLLTFIGSVIFLIACIVFLVPMMGPTQK